MRSLILILLIVIIIGIAKTPKMKEHFNKQACSAKITDIQYLHHMIPHHQVAVDMSILLQKKTRNPTMHNIIRKLMWIQNYEIGLMKHFLKAMPSKFSDYKDMNRHYISTISDFIKPNYLNVSKTYCDPLFFDPKGHMKHMEDMEINDEMYIKHMIPHHQVAVDMSRRLLMYTNNSYLMDFCRKLILDQQGEIYLMNNMLMNKTNYKLI